MTIKGTLPLAEAARELGMGPRTLKAAIAAGDIKASRYGDRMRVSRAEILRHTGTWTCPGCDRISTEAPARYVGADRESPGTPVCQTCVDEAEAARNEQLAADR